MVQTSLSEQSKQRISANDKAAGDRDAEAIAGCFHGSDGVQVAEDPCR